MLSLMNMINIGISLAVALSLPGVARAGMECWPGNMTQARCFASLPPSAMPWPSEGRDSYMSNDQEVLDVEDFTATRVEKDPRNMCDHKDKLVAAMKCVTDAITAKCPFLPEEIMGKTDRFKLAMDNFCDQVDNINVVCMKKHWKTSMSCHDEMMGGKKPAAGKGSGKPTWGSQDGGGTQFGSGGSTSPSKPTMDRQSMNKMICQMKYRMAECVKRNVITCDQKTADVMGQFMKDMSTKECAAMMDRWDVTQPAGGATRVSVGWATAVSSGFFVIALRRMWLA
ncbi:hypothetical protein ACOMHN_040391 [Nucella lapillus]